MKLFILGDAVTPPYNYQGVDRFHPGYIASVEDKHPANRAFYWSTSKFDDGYLHDLDKAKSIVDLYARLEPPQFFEVVQIIHDDESIDIPGISWATTSQTSIILFCLREWIIAQHLIH
jgi:hypothetical protein